ncbi:MAG: RnfABCDGE type electron transport complex subunit D [Drouetiella hepatica Uher 2000/2452]|jgi:Na+-transporting NADH:ubiquinone oxidoreductase subunit NqrB|uniref:RnfABCDGE type electron transport complex subunit D n=1 Tax=Drouetiella hepatica Uher 2000/2452 TaxID=904376 RepID=A0A951UPM9_9CYAN|nr:RnfABCDGE type electron transport complex subunit D [Drouetiella hepatica Uher 2000/2452]
MLFSDARLYQILFLSLFLGVGIVARDWSLHPLMIGALIATCCCVQWIAAIQVSAPFIKSLPSALVTSLGLSLLLRADHVGTLMLAGTLAILSKFCLRVQDKHIFNPGNFGIVAVLTLTQDAWVSPGQWGEEGWYVLLFLSAGGLVLGRIGRWDTSVAFLASYAGLEAVRNLWLGWTWDVWAHRMMSGSLLVFALFMITDPRTVPNARIARIIWAGAIALLTFYLRNFWFISTAPFWALFSLAPLTILLDRMFSGDRFIWHQDALELSEVDMTDELLPVP